MINRLFESFDPIIRLFRFSLIITVIPALTAIPIFFTQNSRFSKTLLLVKNHIFEEISRNLNNKNKNSKILLLWSIFFTILILNILGLLPYVYTITRQILFTLRLALPFWIGFVIFSFFHNTSHFLRHLVPLSTPILLSQFIVIIESISLIIRPITLSVRLCANITAGHILIALASQPIFILNFFTLALIALTLLEIAVAFIQRYVFTLLTTIYLRETN